MRNRIYLVVVWSRRRAARRRAARGESVTMHRLVVFAIATLIASSAIIASPIARATPASTASAPFDPATFNFALESVSEGFERPVDVVDRSEEHTSELQSHS